MQKYYILVVEGEIESVSVDKMSLICKRRELEEKSVKELAEARDIDLEANPEMYAGLSYELGDTGYVESVSIPDVFDEDETFITSQDDEFTFNEVIDKYKEGAEEVEET